MHKLKIATLIGDEEYQKRFVNCLMNYYRQQMEIHIFSGVEQWKECEQGCYHMLLVSELEEWDFLLSESVGGPVIYLLDEEREKDLLLQKEVTEGQSKMQGRELYFVDKYQEVNSIVDEMLKHIGDEVQSVQRTGSIPVKTKIYGIYSLAENEYQLPFAVTMASILSDREKVLLLDLQENSGMTQLITKEDAMGLEDILVMAQGDTFSKARMLSSIGHLDRFDFVYPAENTECLCETGAAQYLKIIQMIIQEMEYRVIILNLGSRFMGFFELLDHCHELYLMQKQGGLCQWREYEFLEELQKRGYEKTKERIHKVELPVISTTTTTCERLVEQWKWNELGDMIRKSICISTGVMQRG